MNCGNSRIESIINNVFNADGIKYSCIEEMLEDLNKIRLIFAPNDFAEVSYNEDIPFEVFTENIPIIKDETPAEAVRDLFIREPLYKYGNDNEINISVVGTFASAICFIKNVKIYSALLGKKCNIKLFCDYFDEIDDCEIISDVLFTLRGTNKNKQYAEAVIENADYIFIDYGTDELNYVITKCICKRLEEAEKESPVIFAVMSDDESYEKGIAVNVTKTDFAYEDDVTVQKLTRMAEMNESTDNYQSNIDKLLRFTYLLHSVGKSDDENELVGILSDKICRKELDSLVVRMHNSNCCDDSFVKNNPDYAVPCRGLGTFYDKNVTNWPKKVDENIDPLDEACIKKANVLLNAVREIKSGSDFFGNGDTASYTIRDNSKQAASLWTAVNGKYLSTKMLGEYVDALDRVLDLSQAALLRKEKLRKNFCCKINNSDTIQTNTKGFIYSRVNSLENIVKPAEDYLRFENPKKGYVTDIFNLPYILCGGKCDKLLIPFYVGENENMLGNIASIMKINPAEVTFVSLSQSEECFDKAIDALKFLKRVIKNHKIKCKINIEQYCAFSTVMRLGDFKVAANAIQAECNIHTCNDLFECINSISDYCRDNEFDLIERNHSELSNMLVGSGIYNKIPFFEFDTVTQRFTKTQKCGWLHSIKTKCSLKIEDMFEVESENINEMLFDYKKMFSFYCDYNIAWKKLAELLEEYHKKRDCLVTVSSNNKGAIVSNEYILEANTAETVTKILSELIKNGFAETDSFVRFRTENSFHFKIATKYQSVAEFFAKSLFGEKQKLSDAKKIKIDIDATTGLFKVFYEDLYVENYSVSTDDFNTIEPLIKKLAECHFIFGSKEADSPTGKNIYFRYSTSAAKAMLIQSGRVLEVHTYSSIYESDEFDEVLSNCCVRWPDSKVSNEFDCIAIKGFNTVFVECKAQNKIVQDFYYKLSALVSKFGINSHGFIVADPAVTFFSNNNKLQIDRGNKLNITTITGRSEIQRVGKTIASVING